jgi:hypothetical protein
MSEMLCEPMTVDGRQLPDATGGGKRPATDIQPVPNKGLLSNKKSHSPHYRGWKILDLTTQFREALMSRRCTCMSTVPLPRDEVVRHIAIWDRVFRVAPAVRQP